MKLRSQWILVLTLIALVFSGCKSDTTQDAVLPPADSADPNCSINQHTHNGKEKLLDMALKISGKKLSAQERNVVMRMLNLCEEDIIRGLDVCAEFSDGQYPTSLDHETVIKQTETWGFAKYGKYDNLPTDLKKEIEEKMCDTFFMASYYKRLIKEGKIPTYYGNNVLAKDKDKILIHWKESDDQYRVVLGNLTRKSVTAEELAELEKLTLE